MKLEEIQSLFDDGHRELTVVMLTGENLKLRLFMSTSGTLAYKAKGRKRSGYALSGIVEKIERIKSVKKGLSRKERYIANLRKYKAAFQNAHPNLWGELRDAYTRLNIDEVEKELANKGDNDSYYEVLREIQRRDKLDLISDNQYKTTTIRANKPNNRFEYWRYQDCIDNIQRHLDNKETFSYSWTASYDVSVKGRFDEDDGQYRAWLSLEFRGCGNGHYYLLVDSNRAVFCEDD